MSLRPRELSPCIVIVGGFLGSGKTSLILAASRLLAQRGMRSAVILNDQGEELVDTRLASARGLPAREVTGGCFCCQFSKLKSEIETLLSWSPHVIFAEPVGSCTDIAATVFGPLREYSDCLRVAPFTVLVDPTRIVAMRSEGADADLAFLFEKQLEEADIVCLSKADLYPNAADVPDKEVRRLSAKTMQGIAEWLDEILYATLESGITTLDIDYARYARAEAALAWLNLRFVLDQDIPLSPAQTVGPFLDRLDQALNMAGISLVHLKLFSNSPTGWLKAALCAHGEEPRVEGDLDASPTRRHEVLVNLRAKGSPGTVQTIVEEQLRRLNGRKLDIYLHCFSPAAPMPERRVARVKS
jgi:hypothetical protein